MLESLLRRARSASPTPPSVARLPHPYRAAVAVSNDCEFMSWTDYLGLYRLLNDRRGLALEVGTSMFFFVTNALCHSSFGYFADGDGTPSTEAPLLREMINAGYVDTIHAYGDFDDGGFKRRHAQLALGECERHAMQFPFWTNHGSAKNFQNLGHGGLSVYQQGDDPGSPHYHLDLLREMGARFFWVDDGYQQSVADGTPVLYYETARDGSELRLVRRYRGLHGKPAPMAGSLAQQMTVEDLDLLVEREEACVYYQHLGAWEKTGNGEFVANRPPYFREDALGVLERLSELFARGVCLVTTPARLLQYLAVRDTLTAETTAGGSLEIRTSDKAVTASELDGVTVRCGRRVCDVFFVDAHGSRHSLDCETIRLSGSRECVVTIPWRRLPEFAW